MNLVEAFVLEALSRFPTLSPERVLTIAMAFVDVTAEEPEWTQAALATAIEQESGFMEQVHSGELRGKAGEICLVQIHPTNKVWMRVAPSFESLAGTDLEATKRCLRAGLETLKHSRSYCYRKRYRKNWAPAMWSKYHLGGVCWGSPHARKRTKAMNGWAYALRKRQKEDTNGTNGSKD